MSSPNSPIGKEISKLDASNAEKLAKLKELEDQLVALDSPESPIGKEMSKLDATNAENMPTPKKLEDQLILNATRSPIGREIIKNSSDSPIGEEISKLDASNAEKMAKLKEMEDRLANMQKKYLGDEISKLDAGNAEKMAKLKNLEDQLSNLRSEQSPQKIQQQSNSAMDSEVLEDSPDVKEIKDQLATLQKEQDAQKKRMMQLQNNNTMDSNTSQRPNFIDVLFPEPINSNQTTQPQTNNTIDSNTSQGPNIIDVVSPLSMNSEQTMQQQTNNAMSSDASRRSNPIILSPGSESRNSTVRFSILSPQVESEEESMYLADDDYDDEDDEISWDEEMDGKEDETTALNDEENNNRRSIRKIMMVFFALFAVVSVGVLVFLLVARNRANNEKETTPVTKIPDCIDRKLTNYTNIAAASDVDGWQDGNIDQAMEWLVRNNEKNSNTTYCEDDDNFVERYAAAKIIFSAEEPNKYVSKESQCSWPPITCTEGYITEINLEGANIQGGLPSEIGILTRLNQVDFGKLYDNKSMCMKILTFEAYKQNEAHNCTTFHPF